MYHVRGTDKENQRHGKEKNKITKKNAEKGQPVAKKHHEVSGSFALLL